MKHLFRLIFFSILLLAGSLCIAQAADEQSAKEKAVAALLNLSEEQRASVYVYKDFSSTENNFTQRAKMFGMDGSAVMDMNENWTGDVHSGTSAIRCEQRTAPGDWGGWMFLNGYMGEDKTLPLLNDGSQPGQGLDLSGADALRFFAKGEQGGEKVEFFTAGFGYDGEWGTQLVPYPDSLKKQSLGTVTLTSDWQEYIIDLAGKDTSYIICGFGYVLDGAHSGAGTSVFFLDDIRFTGEIAYAREIPALLGSYQTENIYIQNAAFTYDNALVAMAFLSEGNPEAAADILDSFVYAIQHDRYQSDRIRNAYARGLIASAPGWDCGTRMPGWYDSEAGTWYEDRYQTGSNVGNTSYAALALLQYDALYGNEIYRETAELLMNWVLAECTDGTDGFTGGYDGWPEAGDPEVVYPFTYKSIEHNIDAYAAFKRLYDVTGEERYHDAADSALRLIFSLYDEEAHYFYTGTTDDGMTPSTENVVLDAQVWNRLALGELFDPYLDALQTVDSMRVDGGGYPFCAANINGGWWAEGTSFTALLYKSEGNTLKYEETIEALIGIQREDGLFPAATVDNLSTGFDLFTLEPWVYSTDAHIAPTAWFIMAVNGFNPYQF